MWPISIKVAAGKNCLRFWITCFNSLFYLNPKTYVLCLYSWTRSLKFWDIFQHVIEKTERSLSFFAWVYCVSECHLHGIPKFITSHQTSPSFQEVDPCEDLTDDDIRTAIQNATGPKSALFVPEVSSNREPLLACWIAFILCQWLNAFSSSSI